VPHENLQESTVRIKLDNKEVKALEDWFLNYVDTFQGPDEQYQANIRLKRDHTLRVREEIINLSEEIGLKVGERRLAEVIALLHDIGRFEQYARYRTFVDRKSVNHAELGVRVIAENGALKGWGEDLKELVIRTILYHNRASLPEDETEVCLLFSRLVRDADKLDIWRVTTQYYSEGNEKRNSNLELGLPEGPEVTEEVYGSLIRGELVNIRYLRTLTDFKLFQVGWIYDLNFEPTIREVLRRRYLDKIRQTLPESDKVEEIFTAVNRYIRSRIAP